MSNVSTRNKYNHCKLMSQSVCQHNLTAIQKQTCEHVNMENYLFRLRLNILVKVRYATTRVLIRKFFE